MDISSLALQKLLQLFPELSSYVVTFKDITGDVPSLEETDMSVGVFIIAVGSRYFYLPVVVKGEIVQPLDSIFDVEEQCFLPLSKNFINLVINSSQNEPGKAGKIPDTVNKNPSVYDLVVPPRTGKFVYASSSRLEEFLSILPNMVKKAMITKVAEDKDVYTALHKLFGLENILESLKPSPAAVVAVSKPAVEIITEGKNLAQAEVTSILDKGYAIRGESPSTRVAVLAHDYDKMGKLHQLASIDAGQDYDVVLKTGETRTAFIPKRAQALPQFPALLKHGVEKERVLAIFANGDYAITSQMVAVGEGRPHQETLKDLFNFSPAKVPSELSGSDMSFALFTPDLELLGVYKYPKVFHSPLGTTIQAENLLGFTGARFESQVTINAFRNCTTIDASDAKNMFVPPNILVVVLGKMLHSDGMFEGNINSAANKLQMTTLVALGSAADIGFDGIEFSYNHAVVGPKHKIIEILVCHEGIDPHRAESFVKQAEERKSVKIYLSKKAEDMTQAGIPEYGAAPQPQVANFGINGNFNSNVATAAGTNDAQAVETTIISELLQVADMRGYVREYLPDIKATLDKLGRTLFLSRIKMDQLALNHNATEVFSFIANLRNCYRLLGDNYLKLEGMVQDSEEITTEKGKKQ
jgi:hypothetical protein